MFLRELFGKPVEVEYFLIIGLGNPGRDYRHNRHNIGFRSLDHLAKSWQIAVDHVRSKALVGQGIWKDRRIFVAKPQTFMNLSGQAVSSLVRYYKVPFNRLLVIYDDLDLPLGTLRLRADGGSAGHKGMTSVIQQLGSNEFPRLRLGIGHPSGRMPVEDYVLQDFTSQEEELLPILLDQSAEAVETFLLEGIHAAMSKFNHSVV
jgi:peptidyl-tRNA hydrolase, PTH1 family